MVTGITACSLESWHYRLAGLAIIILLFNPFMLGTCNSPIFYWILQCVIDLSAFDTTMCMGIFLNFHTNF